MGLQRFFSIRSLSQLTGRNRETISRKLEGLACKPGPKNGKLYNAKEALPLIFDVDRGEQSAINPLKEKALLDEARRKLLELELAQKRGELLSSDGLQTELEDVFSSIRSKLLNLPPKLAQRLSGRKLPGKEIEKESKELIEEALLGLVGIQVGKDITRDDP